MKSKDKKSDFVGIMIVDPINPKFMPSPNELEKVDTTFTPADLDESAGE